MVYFNLTWGPCVSSSSCQDWPVRGFEPCGASLASAGMMLAGTTLFSTCVNAAAVPAALLPGWNSLNCASVWREDKPKCPSVCLLDVSPLQTSPPAASSARDQPAEPEASRPSSPLLFSCYSSFLPRLVVPPSVDTFRPPGSSLSSFFSFLVWFLNVFFFWLVPFLFPLPLRVG